MEETTSRGLEDKRKRRRRIAMVVAWVTVVFLHLALFVHVTRFAPIFSGQPLTWIDFDIHAVQMFRVTDALAGWGKHWAYDTNLLAGYPVGTVFNADNKGWEIWTYGLWQLGIPRPIAFNLFVLFVHLLVPGTIYLSARLFRLERWEALLAASLGICLWFFDGMARWSWYSGAVSFGLVTFLFLLPLALFYAHLRSGKLWLLFPLTVVMSLGHLVHPSLFVLLVVPMTALYARSFRSLGWKRHAAIIAVALVVIASNTWWLIVTFQFIHYVTDHEPFFIGKLHHVFLDMAGLIDDLTRTGIIGNRTGFRFLAILAAIAMLVIWRRDRDDRFLPLASGIGFLLFLTYMGGYFWLFEQLQPYRNIVPAAFLASIPAAALVGELVRRGVLRALPPLAWLPFGLASFLGASHLMKDVLYFFPLSLPLVPPLPTGELLNVSTYGFPPHRDFRYYPPEPHFDDATEWVRKHDDGQGRFLVEWWVLGEHLQWRTNAQVLGGFRQRNLDHRAANFFHRHPRGDATDEQLARYLEDYAVRWVIVTMELPFFESKGILEKVADVGAHRVYRTKVPISYIRGGGGRVRSSLNRIDVEGTDPDRDVVLRFHWFETLVCEPDCRVEREPLEENPVGFIRIPAPHPSGFSVINGY